MLKKYAPFLRLLVVILLLLPYLLYVGFVIQKDQGPVDYETFMAIGQRLRNGQEVYGENSYYPMPFVLVFAVFSALPRAVSMAVWLLAPVLSALWITRGNPWVLVFAPLFGHFVGGQTALFGMLGLWGYRQQAQPQQAAGGVFLALTLLKPQLGLIPLAYAVTQWWQALRTTRQVPRQAWAWAITLALLYLPGFFWLPDWPSRWLAHPRPLFERAMAGFIPRILLYLAPPQSWGYWLALGFLAASLGLAVWVWQRKTVQLDWLVLWSFIISPLVHDYDLIQLIPLLDTPRLWVSAVLLSVPGWLVIVFAYSHDAAWQVFTLIAPGLLGVWLWQKSQANAGAMSGSAG